MKRQPNKGMILYEEVLQKNFQIIETFLNKFPLIFKKQDFFQQSIKKINEKIFKQEQENQKLRQDLHLTSNILQKKIQNSKENIARQSRSSVRISQQLIPLEERKNSIFRVSSGLKEQRQSAHFSKEKSELIVALQKKQHQNSKKLLEMQAEIQKMQQKLNFLSVLQSKNEEHLDKLKQQKVGISSFDKLSSQFQLDFLNKINKMGEEKYFLGSKLIEKKVANLEVYLTKQIQKIMDSVKLQLLAQIEKKAGVNQFRSQLGQIKDVIQKMVQESVQSFASKEQTKKALLLFQKKFIKLQLVLEEVLNEALKNESQDHGLQCLTLPGRRQKQVMNGFGRKRRIQK